ncbi:MAG: uroporphyrinogen-III C-methyltransferase [Phenylobacterium sp.]|uniref:uroporphyrinogen-III C-methyltransferase n=1 Tax=Phenylobacterium sp. TaxID=1871053 RepID=UPI00301A3AA6
MAVFWAPARYSEAIAGMADPGKLSRRRSLVVVGGGAGLHGAAPRVTGRVWLAGAGPGDPDLMTVRAVRVLSQADVVVHDGLVPEAILALAPDSARRISVAKRKSRHTYAQEEINRLLVGLASEGLNVVRLKGGDPFIFGRGGEELEACRAAGVPCEVIPGITAALAASASAGAPLTHRRSAQAVTFVTGHAAGDSEPDLDWEALARPNHTVVVYMGASTAGRIADRLIAAGRAPRTPALVVFRASRPDEVRCVTTLGALGEAATAESGPALLIVGEAMAEAIALAPTDFVRREERA